MTFADKFRLKVMIVDGNATEHFWVIPFKRTATGFVGILANEPELVHRLRDVQENVEGRGGLHAPPIRLRLLNGSPLFDRFVSCPHLARQRCRSQRRAEIGNHRRDMRVVVDRDGNIGQIEEVLRPRHQQRKPPLPLSTIGSQPPGEIASRRAATRCLIAPSSASIGTSRSRPPLARRMKKCIP